MIKPTIGRVVWFTPADGEQHRWDKSQPMAALVTYVWSSDQPATRYHYRREGLHWVIRAGTGTRPLFKVWRERTAIVLCTELLCAFLDGDFARREKERAHSAEGDPT